MGCVARGSVLLGRLGGLPMGWVSDVLGVFWGWNWLTSVTVGTCMVVGGEVR